MKSNLAQETIIIRYLIKNRKILNNFLKDQICILNAYVSLYVSTTILLMVYIIFHLFSIKFYVVRILTQNKRFGESIYEG